jgi:hypothetical protein
MKTINSAGTTAINPEQLIGTKWTTWKNVYGDMITVEFIDRSNCIYTSQPKKYKLKYSINEGKMFISNIEGSFELKGDVLFNNDLPAFEKAA